MSEQDNLENIRRERMMWESGVSPETASLAIRHSRFIRRLRLILPVIAVMMIVAVFSWNMLSDDDVAMVREAAQMPRQTAANELLNPRFESTDSKNQPFTIIAKRAVQDAADHDLLQLESPTGDVMLNNGHWLAVRSRTGAYGQAAGTLRLSGDVELFHDLGYQFSLQQIDMDLKAQTAMADTAVEGFGVDLKLNAAGLTADMQTGHLIFHGPATLVLKRGMKGFDKAFVSPELKDVKESKS